MEVEGDQRREWWRGILEEGGVERVTRGGRGQRREGWRRRERPEEGGVERETRGGRGGEGD